ncbi:MAG: hypothetical protein R2818_03205 [Flavobacteriales bacterium]
MEHHQLLVYPREGLKEHLSRTIYHGHPGVRVVADAPLYPISSTELRADLKAWKPMGDRLSAKVLSYIRQHRLYRGSREKTSCSKVLIPAIWSIW